MDDRLLKLTASKKNIFTSTTKSNEKVLSRIYWNISGENPLEIHLQSVQYQISTLNMAIKKVKLPKVLQQWDELLKVNLYWDYFVYKLCLLFSIKTHHTFSYMLHGIIFTITGYQNNDPLLASLHFGIVLESDVLISWELNPCQ